MNKLLRFSSNLHSQRKKSSYAVTNTADILFSSQENQEKNSAKHPKKIYYQLNGYRYVYPYYYSRVFNAKEAIFNKNILEAFLIYTSLLKNEIINRIERGDIKVNGCEVTSNYLIKKNDKITHKNHRHEGKITSEEIKILYCDENIIVVDKPSGIPTHPCGAHHFNSVTKILENEYNMNKLYCPHRLDRVTSGILILCKSKDALKKIGEEFRNRKISKSYLALVEGKFPSGVISCNIPLKIRTNEFGKVTVKIKPALTKFYKVKSNNNFSLILCYPITGRQHQLRKHLQLIGYPIVNDKNYGKIKAVKHIYEVISQNDSLYEKDKEYILQEMNKSHSHRESSNNYYKMENKYISTDPNCSECKYNHADSYLSSICLHALKYKHLEWEFNSDLPLWSDIQNYFKTHFIQNSLKSLPRQNLKDIYYFKNGLRHVYPYYYKHFLNAPASFIGKSIVNVIQQVNPANLKEILIRLNIGHIRVNEKMIKSDFTIKKNDFITGIGHIHEIPVTSNSISVIYCDANYLVVDKPSNIPVHPTGNYFYNSVTKILELEYSTKKLYLMHRLDKATSGLLIICKNVHSAQKASINMKKYQIKKKYIALIHGNFPSSVIKCAMPITSINNKDVVYSAVTKMGKSAVTVFNKINFDGKYSLVLCYPITGRQHQIRAHLNYLGYNIVNDSLYNKLQANDPLYEIVNSNNGYEQDKDYILNKLHLQNSSQMTENKEYYKFNEESMHHDENCNWCNGSLLLRDSICPVIGLHSFSYESPNWKFETKLPSWALGCDLTSDHRQTLCTI